MAQEKQYRAKGTDPTKSPDPKYWEMDIRLVEICLAQEVQILDFWVQLLSFF